MKQSFKKRIRSDVRNTDSKFVVHDRSETRSRKTKE